jgi:hypothetical protein
LLERYVEAGGEPVVRARLQCQELICGYEGGAAVVLAAARRVTCRVAGELAGLDVARVEREEADERLERVAVGEVIDGGREVEATRRRRQSRLDRPNWSDLRCDGYYLAEGAKRLACRGSRAFVGTFDRATPTMLLTDRRVLVRSLFESPNPGRVVCERRCNADRVG